ncbi:uncharacterized protein LOC111483242 [Cucurbita maxima]|uniref:Uncharacterized protein LOC111483242 n=1 Tax=Cucurbita maxima TaxID=3661 RepID=A0A6J1JCR7_CUCMA|nr:uncharacterized protein LOC111483242 [Cucurbita maxima]XP_022985154.1 uncharacterized protein LOC111483242 [Cucurbita maxima]
MAYQYKLEKFKDYLVFGIAWFHSRLQLPSSKDWTQISPCDRRVCVYKIISCLVLHGSTPGGSCHLTKIGPRYRPVTEESVFYRIISCLVLNGFTLKNHDGSQMLSFGFQQREAFQSQASSSSFCYILLQAAAAI